MNTRIRLIIAEKRTLIRKSLYALLKEYSQVEIAADVGDSDELFNLLKTSTPEIIFIGSGNANSKNTGLLKRIQSRFPSIKVIILSEKTIWNILIIASLMEQVVLLQRIVCLIFW